MRVQFDNTRPMSALLLCLALAVSSLAGRAAAAAPTDPADPARATAATATAAAATPTAASAPLSHDGVSHALQSLSSRVASAAVHLAGDFRNMTDLPALSGWLATRFATDTDRRNLAVAAGRALLTLLAAAAVEFLLRRWLLRRAAPPRTHPLVAAHPLWASTWRVARAATVLLIAAVVGNALTLLLLTDFPIARTLAFGIVNTYLVTRLLMIVVNEVVRDAPARQAKILLVLLTLGLGVEWIGSDVLSQLGASPAIQESFEKLIALLVHVVLIIMVIHSRRRVARWIKRQTGANPTLSALGEALAAVWPFVAVAAIACAWLVWAMEVPDAYHQFVRFVGVTIAVLLASRFIGGLLLSLLDRRLSRFADAPASSFGARFGKYQRSVSGLLRALLVVVTLIALTEAWGVESLSWFSTGHFGHRGAVLLFKLSLLVAIGIAAWEAADVAFESRVARLTASTSVARAVRLRTLQPIIRVALVITLALLVIVTALNEIGINVGPLLAGAGIFGVALGFGSQKLVQDFITGIFLLVEDAVDVGDWVTVAGLSGTVEHLSIRTIRLRAGDGSVHLIPFSSVTSVTNTNRGVGNAAVSVNVDSREDTDRVATLLQDIVREMRAEAAYADLMRGDLELWGVDKVDGTMATLAGQIVCSDAGRWAVQREFNRRMKKRFELEGVALALPQQTLHIARPPAATGSGSA